MRVAARHPANSDASVGLFDSTSEFVSLVCTHELRNSSQTTNIWSAFQPLLPLVTLKIAVPVVFIRLDVDHLHLF